MHVWFDVLAASGGILVVFAGLMSLALYERARAYRRIQGDEVSCAKRAKRLRFSMPDKNRTTARRNPVRPVAANSGGRKSHCA